jgi:hypothetical protein
MPKNQIMTLHFSGRSSCVCSIRAEPENEERKICVSFFIFNYIALFLLTGVVVVVEVDVLVVDDDVSAVK